jgi:hypothetical protein
MTKARTKKATRASSPPRAAEAELRRLLAEYDPEIAHLMSAARRKLRSRIRRGFELIYDSYNGVGIGYGATQKYSAPVVSLVAYPRWVTLFFLYGATLDDPHNLLQGTGSRVRSIRLASADALDDPRVGALLEQALRRDQVAFAAAPTLRPYVQLVAAARRPRTTRPARTPPAGPRSVASAAADPPAAPESRARSGRAPATRRR